MLNPGRSAWGNRFCEYGPDARMRDFGEACLGVRNEVINWICRRAKAGSKIRECIVNEWVWVFDIESVVELE